jgi:hypothetical protein
MTTDKVRLTVKKTGARCSRCRWRDPERTESDAVRQGTIPTGIGHFPKDAGWLRDFATTAATSRLYGCIHTRADNEVGLQVGRQVAGVTLQRLRGLSFAYD